MYVVAKAGDLIAPKDDQNNPSVMSLQRCLQANQGSASCGRQDLKDFCDCLVNHSKGLKVQLK